MAEQSEILFDKIDKTECPSCHGEIDVGALEAFSRAACPTCGAEFTVPARLSTYRLLACLGSGGMGSVYRAYDETLAREVAIKVMKKSLGQQPEFLESFRREAQAAAKLNHPNIAQIYSFGEEKGQPYIVMEYVPGKHLEDLIEGPDQLPQEMVMKIGLDIADGLQLATASNLIHGDIKPGNILMDDRNAAKLVDFGIASSPDAEQTEIWGTPYYISPEKIKREKIDFRSDMYCLGGTLYHAIAKKPPFDGEDAMAVVKARLAAPPRPLREWRPDVDPDVERIIMKTLESDPDRRYASYGDLMADISAYLSRGKSHPVGPSAGGSSKRIIIKSRSGRNRPALDAAPGEGAAASTPPVLHVPGDGPGTPPKDAEADKPRKPIGRVLAVIAVLLVAAGGGAFAYVRHGKAVAAEKAREEREALVASQGARLQSLSHVKDGMARLAEEVARHARMAEGIVGEAVNLAAGDDAGLAAAITREKPFDFAAETAGAAETSEAEAAGAEEAQGEAADASGDAGAGEPAADGATALPEGLPPDVAGTLAKMAGSLPPEAVAALSKAAAEGPAAVLAALGKMGDSLPPDVADALSKIAAAGPAGLEGLMAGLPEGFAEAVGNAAEAVAGAIAADGAVADLADAGDADSEDAGDADVLDGYAAKARGIFLALAPVRRADAFAKMAVESAEGLFGQAAEKIASLDAGKLGDDELKKAVAENIAQIEGMAKSASEQLESLKEQAGVLDGLVMDARAALDGLKAAIAADEAERERKAAEAKAAEEARAEREKREAAEAARQAAEEAEVEKVRAVVPSHAANVAEWKIDPILHELDRLEETLSSRRAKEALKIERRRAEGLRDLKEFLIGRLSSQDRFVHPRDKWSVVSANARGLEIKPAKPKDAKPQRRKWEELRPAQVVPMLIHYLGDKDKAKAIPLRERIAAYVDMAVYFIVASGDDAHAVEAAKAYCQRAISESPSKRQEIAETLYELDLDAE